MTKSCPKGQYYCYTDKKCKKIPKGYAIGARGYLRQEPQDDDSKKNGNGKSNGHSKSNGGHGNGGGNGNGGNGSGGNGGGVSEATMTPSQKRKDTMLKKKYDDSGMMKSMKKQYGKEEGKKVYYATIRKQAMETKYYDGSDRNPATGLPKGLNKTGGGTKTIDPKLKRVPHEILRAHTEIPVTDIQVSDLDELTDYKSFAAKAQEIRDKRKQRKEDQKQKDKEYMAKKKERAEKGIRFYDTKGKGYMKGGIKTYEGVNEEGLRDWFGKSKSKDGKPGWVNVKTGGTCASDEPGEGTPKCVSSAKRASMSKAERESASRRKKAADPGQQSKTGAAKPTYVSTDKPKKKKMTEEKKNKNVKGIAKELDKAVAMHKSQAKRLRKAGVSEENVVEAKDKKGKGSGSKDACYHKVKSRYSVWPSAYASGALVKCRKVGAANWGNKSEEVVNELDTTTLHSYVTKASSDAVKTGVDAGIAGMAGKDKKRDKKLDKAYKRSRGINRAATKLAVRAIRKEETLPEAKVDKGRSDYGKASIRNYRRMGPGHDDPGMFDPEGKRGKAIEKRREEHKARRGVKGAKVPAYKVDEGSSYGLYKGSGKPGGAMKDFLDKKAKKLEKQRASQSDAAKNNPHFDSTQPSPSGRNKYEEVKLDFNEKRNLGDRMERKMKLMKKTTAKAMDFARNEGEASGHARYNMGRLGNEMEKLGKKRREANEEKSFQQFQEKCWPGYEKKGMKTMFGKRYPNCVKKKK